MLRGFPGGSDGKEFAYNTREQDSVPGSGRSPGEGNGNPLQYSCLRNPMDRGAKQATVHGVTRVGHNLATKPPPPLHPGSKSACSCTWGHTERSRVWGERKRDTETKRERKENYWQHPSFPLGRLWWGWWYLQVGNKQDVSIRLHTEQPVENTDLAADRGL